MKKKRDLIRIALVIVFSVVLIPSGVFVSAGGGKIEFTDLKEGHWAYEPVMAMAEAGILAGYPDGSFRPGAEVTHGEFVRMACMAAELGAPQTIVGEHWALGYYNAGLNNFLFTEFDIEKKALDQPIRRNRMALIASSALSGAREYGDHSALLAEIQDIDHRTAYEFEIVKAYGLGILSGYPDGGFRPDGTLTRVEAAVAASRLREKLLESETPVPGINEDPGPEHPAGEGGARPNSRPLIDKEPFDTSAPEGTFMLRMENVDGDMREEKRQLKELLELHFPAEGEALYEAFVKFIEMDTGGSALGICKQYVLGYPILFNLLGESYEIRIYSKDYQDEYWETKPGQVNVFFI